MLEGISADTIWNENVVAFTDKEAVTLVPVEDQKISKDGVRIYDISLFEEFSAYFYHLLPILAFLGA